MFCIAAVAKGVGNTADEKMAVPTETDGLSSPHNGETLTAGSMSSLPSKQYLWGVSC